MKSLTQSTYRECKVKLKKVEWSVCFIVMCGLLVGCDMATQQTQSNQEKSSQKNADADTHSHPNLSLHKPKTLVNAVQRLSQMHDALRADGEFPTPITIQYVEVIHGQGASGHSHFYSATEYDATEGDGEHDGHPGHHSEENETVKYHSMEVDLRTELTDIVGWLPDIAAKSNLDETDWNAVNSVSDNLTKIIAAIPADASDASFRESWKQKSAEIKVMLDELQAFVDSSGTAK